MYPRAWQHSLYRFHNRDHMVFGSCSAEFREIALVRLVQTPPRGSNALGENNHAFTPRMSYLGQRFSLNKVGLTSLEPSVRLIREDLGATPRWKVCRMPKSGIPRVGSLELGVRRL